MKREDMRVWAVYDNLIGRIEFLSESRSECDRIKHLYDRSPMIRYLEILRFDLSPLYFNRKPDHFGCELKKQQFTKTKTN